MGKGWFIWCGLFGVGLILLVGSNNIAGTTSYSHIPTEMDHEDFFIYTEIYKTEFSHIDDFVPYYFPYDGISLYDDGQSKWLEINGDSSEDYVISREIHLEYDTVKPGYHAFSIELKFKIPLMGDVDDTISAFDDPFYILKNDIIEIFLEKKIENFEKYLYLFGQSGDDSVEICDLEIDDGTSFILNIYSFDDDYDVELYSYDDDTSATSLLSSSSLDHAGTQIVNHRYKMGDIDSGETGTVRWDYFYILGRPDSTFFDNFEDNSLVRWGVKDYTGDSQLTAKDGKVYINTYSQDPNNWKAILQTMDYDTNYEVIFYCDFNIQTPTPSQVQNFWLGYCSQFKVMIDNGCILVKARDHNDEDDDGDTTDPIFKELTQVSSNRWYNLRFHACGAVVNFYINNYWIDAWYPYTPGGSLDFVQIGDFGTSSIVNGIYLDNIWIRNSISEDRDSDGLSDFMEDTNDLIIFTETGEYSWTMEENLWYTEPYIPNPSYPDLYEYIDVWEKEKIDGTVQGEPKEGHCQGISQSSKGYSFGTGIGDTNANPPDYGYLPDTIPNKIYAQALVSPAIDLSNLKNDYTLSFSLYRYIYLVQDTASVRMEYTIDDGATWNLVWFDSYNQDPPVGQIKYGWTGGSTSTKHWTYEYEESEVGQCYWVGQDSILRVRFIIMWAGDTNEEHTGFYFDDLTIEIASYVDTPNNPNLDADTKNSKSLMDGEEFYLGTSMFLKDTENDGLDDVDELLDPVIANPGLFNGAADPIIRDIFVEIDWLNDGSCGCMDDGEHGSDGMLPMDDRHHPPEAKFNHMAAIFSEHGIKLHLELGSSVSGVVYKKLSPSESHDLYEEEFTSNRKPFFRYIFIGCKADPVGYGADVYGVTEFVQVPGSFCCIFDGKIEEHIAVGKTNEIMLESTILHELGHTLGLYHYTNAWSFYTESPYPTYSVMVQEMLNDNEWDFLYIENGDVFFHWDDDFHQEWYGYFGGWMFAKQYVDDSWDDWDDWDYGLSINGVRRGKTWS